MPKWIHERAKYIQAKNPSMPEGQAFAIATQQAHATGKSPKGYGTSEGRSTAKAKYTTPKDDKKTANPGGLESSKIAFADELLKIALVERLVRLGATDVPGTPRLVMRHRSPEELAQLQQSVEDSWTRAAAPMKEKAHAVAQYVPTQRGKVLAEKGMGFLIDNPEQIPLQAVPLPGVSFAALAAKKGLENTIDRIAPLQKAAFLSGGHYLLDQVGKPKVRRMSAEPPDESLKVAKLDPKYVLSVGLANGVTLDCIGPILSRVNKFGCGGHSFGIQSDEAVDKDGEHENLGCWDGDGGALITDMHAKSLEDGREWDIDVDTGKSVKSKTAMFPTTPTPMGSTGMNAQKKLMKSQRVGTLDDKNSIDFKPLNQAGKGTSAPGVANSSGSSSSSTFSAKIGAVRVDKLPPGTSPVAALGPDLSDNQRRAVVGGKTVEVNPHVKEAAALMVKWAFGSTGFGPTGGVFRPQYASYQGQTPIPSPVMMDPHIKQSGSCEQPSRKKVAFSQSGYGEATSIAPTSGNAGRHASYQGQIPVPSPVVLDPHIKRAGNALSKAASIPLTPKGRLSASSREGKPKTTGFDGPSIAETAKPIGFGKTLPGASKNGI